MFGEPFEKYISQIQLSGSDSGDDFETVAK